MYQRYITNTLSIVPGVTNQTTGGTNGLGAFNVAGQRTSGTAVFEDGVFTNDPLTSNNLVIWNDEGDANGPARSVFGLLAPLY